MDLPNGVEKTIKGGTYQLAYVIGTGTAKLQQSIDGGSFLDVPDSDKSATTAVVIDLCGSDIKSVLTGDATLSLNRIPN